MSSLTTNPTALLALLFVCFTLPGISSHAADTPAQAASNPTQTRGKTAKLDESFARLDKNGDGVISKEEAAAGDFRRFSVFDSDGNGSVSRREFREFWLGHGRQDNGEWVTSDLEMVDVGAHKLQILRSGQGSPTVVFESGAAAGDGIRRWREMLPRIAQITSVVCYSRAGRGGSEPAKGPRTPEAITKDLHDLLEKAGYKPPYILVGASLGGIYARIFAMRYSKDMAGLVLIDPEHERVGFERDRLAKRSVEDRAKRKQSFIAEYEKKNDVSSSEQLGLLELSWSGDASVYGTIPNIPLVMITSLQGDPENEKRREFLEVHRSVHSEVFKSSTLGMHIVTDQARHAVYADDPDLVINAILWTVDMARKHGTP